jgi:hypothetical protein
MQAKKLETADFETGMAFERRVAAAQQAFIAANAGYQAFVEILRERYGAPAPAWTLTDWAEGFVPVERGDGDG